MKNVVNVRGEFLCCGHTVTTAVESHFHSRRLAPRVLAQGGEAVALEVAMAMKRFGGASYNNYSRRPVDPSFTLSTMDIINTPQPPKRFKNSELMECMKKVMRNQEAIAHIFWTASQTQGARLDGCDAQLEAVRDRLWRMECVLKIRARQT